MLLKLNFQLLLLEFFFVQIFSKECTINSGSSVDYDCNNGAERYCRIFIEKPAGLQKKCTDCTFQGARLAGDDFCKDRFDHSEVPKVRTLRNARANARDDVECHDNDRNGKRQGLCAIEDESHGISDGKMTCIGYFYKGVGSQDRQPRPGLKIQFDNGRDDHEIHYHMDDNLQLTTAQVKLPVEKMRIEGYQQLNLPSNKYMVDLYNECKKHVQMPSVEWDWSWGVRNNKNFFPGSKGTPEDKSPQIKETFTRYVLF